MKNRVTNVILVIVLVLGLAIFLYPSFSDYWNSFHQSRAIAVYAEELENLSNEEYDRLFEAAEEYNKRMQDLGPRHMDEAELADYESQLSFNGSGMMGYIEIPSIKCYLSIYHGTSEAVLQIATGHIEWTSLPVGGASTHSVISGHRGLPSAKLFTELDKLRVGDRFSLFILGKELAYEVCQINTVTPDYLDLMTVVPGEDYVTLVTCTPYGINTHRLLVRGTRVETISDNTLHFTSEAIEISAIVVAGVLAAPILFALLLLALISPGESEARKREDIRKKAMEMIQSGKGIGE